MTISYTKLQNNISNHDTIYSLAEKIGYEHKLIRFYLEHYNINYKHLETVQILKNKSFSIPTIEDLFNKGSILAHNLYLCEGWHTKKTNTLFFTNRNEKLIEIFSECLFNTYHYDKPIMLEINLNNNCSFSLEQKKHYENFFSNNEKYNIFFTNSNERKNAIIRAKAGGKNLARLFIENAYKILSEINKAD